MRRPMRMLAGTAAAVSCVAMGAALTAAPALAAPLVKHAGPARGIKSVTVPMTFANPAAPATPAAPAGRGGIRPDGEGQNPGNCGLATLWTNASTDQYKLGLASKWGPMGVGAYEVETDGEFALPEPGGINGNSKVGWNSGWLPLPDPGLFPNIATAVGEVATAQGPCTIYVVAPWN